MNPQTAIRNQRIRVANRQAAVSLLVKLATLLLAVLVLFGLVFGITPMKGGDMQPKFAAGDLLLYYRLNSSYARGDVVVMNRDGAQYVGRIVGMPGETIEVTDARTLRVDGAEIVEPDIYFETQAFQEAVTYPLDLQANEYFILGDARESAKDSRYFGAVAEQELKGKVISALRRVDI